MGAVATPLETEFNTLAARAETSTQLTYKGVSKH